MAEGIAAGVAETVITQLGSIALQELSSALGVKKEVQRLQETLTAIKGVLPHAENLQLSNNNVKDWLRRIKDAAYEAEDVIDAFNTEALRRKLVMHGSITKRVRYFASSSNPIILRFKIAHGIQKVRENLRYIKDDQSFGLDCNFQVNHGFLSEGRQTHSFISEEDVVGRDVEQEKIVNLLLLGSSGRNGLCVIPIRGMGGIGKTALAQLVYNDKRVIDSFGENRMWICVSDDFDLQKITEKIIRSGTNKECPKLDMDQLQSHLREHLGGKRYLLVLDDIWNDDVNKWEELKKLLVGGAHGSKIIVTTRSERVAAIMETESSYQLSRLSEDNCWNLFKGRAFKEGQEEIDLVEIGKVIAKKCVGVPLAAKTLGALCYLKDKRTWENVRDSDVWKLPEEQNGILHALKISYYYLPFYLQQCFAYCSIFPKDHEIHKDMLIKLWIAQGFIHSFGDNRSLEDIGSEYVKVLMWKSFFQEPYVDVCGNLIRFKMHDLVHDLAQSVAGVECFTVCKDNEECYPEGARHLFVNIEGPCSSLKISGVIPEIRTLIFEFHNDFSFGSIISSLKFLRVFVFRNDDIKHLPNSIDKLKHLRYLELECHKIKSLPESITNLQNLQVLKLECGELEKLPKRIQNMISLRHIDLVGKFFNTKLSHMPSGVKELKSLETLSHFVVGKNGVGCALKGLNELTNLGGVLRISNLENVKNGEQCGERNLKDKKKLWELRLCWKPFEEADIKREERRMDLKALESLEPPSNLKILVIEGYSDIKFSRWMMDSSTSLRNVLEIHMRKCHQCKQLFPLSLLPSLKRLELAKMNNLEYIEGDRPDVQSGKECFSSLTSLYIEKCPNLESWFPAVEAQSQQQHLLISFPSLRFLIIYDCPKLKSVPHLVPSSGIKQLTLWETTGEVAESLVGVSNPTNSSSLFTSLRELNIREYSGMESWPNWLVGSHLPSLRKLSIGCTRSLPFLPQQIQRLPALQELGIFDYCEEALPEWVANITSSSLGELYLRDCPNLKILPEWVLRDNTTVVELWIAGCPHLFDRYNEETGEDRHKIAHIRLTDIKL